MQNFVHPNRPCLGGSFLTGCPYQKIDLVRRGDRGVNIDTIIGVYMGILQIGIWIHPLTTLP